MNLQILDILITLKCYMSLCSCCCFPRNIQRSHVNPAYQNKNENMSYSCNLESLNNSCQLSSELHLMSDGEVLRSGSYHELLASSKEFLDLVDAHKETAGTEHAEVSTSRRHNYPTKEIKSANNEDQYQALKGDQLIKQEEREVGDAGFKPYLIYLNQNKGHIYFTIFALSHLAFVTGQILQSTWMASDVDDPQVSKSKLIVVYLIIGFCSTICLLIRSLAVVTLGMESSKSLFAQLLNYVFRGPMSFYDSTPLGRILSRISSDLSIIDLDIPFNFQTAFGATTISCATLGVITVIIWQVLIVSIPVIYIAIRLHVSF